ncbi:MAG: hypothetical protein M3071_03595 [Actinomycetota bacterium]|nr:hypothetical protein [Actinomycetota bacterium]
MTSVWRALLIAGVLLVVVGCGASTPGIVTSTVERVAPQVRWLLIGQSLSPRRVEVMGIPGTIELQVEDPSRASGPPVFVTLARGVPREPRDVCFGVYVGNENPADGDIGCQVRGSEPLVIMLGDSFIPGPLPGSRFTTLYGQADRTVTRLELLGPGERRTSLPMSTHRVFLVAFSPSARGAVRLRAHLADGTKFTHQFALPLTRHEAGAWPRLRRRGAVFNYGIGENIVSESYRQILRQFGPPLKSFTERHGVRCIYYDIVGYQNGWKFCFKGQAMLGAAGSQTAPRGVQ